MIDQNYFKSILPGHRFNPPPFLCPFFLTITFSIVGKDWYQCQICAELSRLQHQRTGPECIWFYCRKGQHLEWGESFYRSWGEVRGGIFGKERGKKGRGLCPGKEGGNSRIGLGDTKKRQAVICANNR